MSIVKQFAWVFLALALCVITISGRQLLEVRETYREGDENYARLTDRVRPRGFQPHAAPESTIDIPDLAIDFAALTAINSDAVAWLYGPETVIDYPVMRATDYDYYLHHLPDGTLNANGALFIDYNWKNFDDELIVVYGHNMKSGRMFGSLTQYKKQSYYEAHPYLYLYTAQDKNYRIDLMYGCVIEAGQWRERAFTFVENLDSLLAYAQHHTTFVSDTQYAPGDKIIALATCSYEFDNARYVVLGVLRS